jgi:hypothetical protein
MEDIQRLKILCHCLFTFLLTMRTWTVWDCASRPQISANDLTPSYGLLLTCRGEKCVQYYSVIQRQYYLGKTLSNANAKSPLLGRWPSWHNANFTPVCSHVGMLEINCPISQKPPTPSPLKSRPFSTHKPTNVTQHGHLNRVDRSQVYILSTLTLSLTAPCDPLYLTALGLICPIKIGRI